MSVNSFVIKLDCDYDSKIGEPINVYCLPISGGSFVSQCGLLSEVYEAKWIANGRKLSGSEQYQPEIVFASSGGNIATYVAMAGDWSPTGIMRVAIRLKSTMFIRSWLPKCLSFIPSWVVGAFNGSMYKAGVGSVDLFRSLFTPITVKKTEIWTGTYDHTNKKAQFFCNLSKGESKIKPEYFDDSSHFHGCMPLKYLGGSIEKITTACIASASIPIMTSRKELEGSSYADGGVMYASPTSVMMPEVHRIVNNRILHLIYFCAYEMDMPKNISPEGSVGSFASHIGQLVHANALLDRAAAIRLIYQLAKENYADVSVDHYPNLNKKLLAQLFIDLGSRKHYVMVLYPHGSHAIVLQKFSCKDIVHGINLAKKGYGAYIWHSPCNI